MWSLTEYDKIVFLDSDMMVEHNLDELFEQEELSAVPDIFTPPFNAGLMVLKPNKETYQSMLDIYMNTPSKGFGDQGFLNVFFSSRWVS